MSSVKMALLSALNATCGHDTRMAYRKMHSKLQMVRVVTKSVSELLIPTVHVAVTALPTWSNGRWTSGFLRDMRVLVLSAMLETSAPLEFHVQTTVEWRSQVDRIFADLNDAASAEPSAQQAPRTLVAAHVYCVDLQAIGKLQARMRIRGASPPQLFSRCLLPAQLYSLERVLYLDTDMVVISDLAVLWRQFDVWPSQVALGAVPITRGGVGKWCSCAMRASTGGQTRTL